MAPLFTFEQSAASLELTVRVAVPPHTQAKGSVTVSATAERLRVSVAGHSRQPNVLDGELFYDVDPDSLSWALEGSGESRRLVISLEKAEPISWSDGLFRYQTAAEAPPPEPPRAPPAAPRAPPAASQSARVDYSKWDRLDASSDDEESATEASLEVDGGIEAEDPSALCMAPVAAAMPSASLAAAAAAAPVAAAPAPVARRTGSMDYTKWDNLDASDDEDDARKRDEPNTIGGVSAEIWDQLISGKKKLLTKDGIVGGQEVARALKAATSDQQRSLGVKDFGEVD